MRWVGLVCSCFLYADSLVLSLEDVEKLALTQNKLLLELHQEIYSSKAYTAQSITKWLPDLRATYFMYQDSVNNPISNSKSNFLTHIQLTQELFHADTYYGIQLAKRMEQLQKDLYTSAKNDVLFAVRAQYFKIVTDQHLIDAAEEKVRLFEQLAEQMADRQRIGTAIEFSVNQTLVAVSNAMQEYYQSIQVLRDDMDALAEMLGMTPGEQELCLATNEVPIHSYPDIACRIRTTEVLFSGREKKGPLFSPLFPRNERTIMMSLYTTRELEYLSKQALLFNPVLKQFASALAVSEAEVGKAYGKYMPNVSLKGNMGGIPDPFEFYPSSNFGNQVFHKGVGINFSWTIFDSLGREKGVEKAKYNRNAKRFSLEKQKQTVVKDVRTSIHGIEEAIASYVSANANAKLAVQMLEQAKDQLEVGYIDIFDYEIAVNQLIQAKTAKINSQFGVLRSYFGLEHTIGEDL